MFFLQQDTTDNIVSSLKIIEQLFFLDDFGTKTTLKDKQYRSLDLFK